MRARRCFSPTGGTFRSGKGDTPHLSRGQKTPRDFQKSGSQSCEPHDKAHEKEGG
ncbi:MAG: hypothetical protein S4CHLAM102_11670 [Chlamydiia bacterium]|nr:hypothetical protein [Chlamydiia bacterium]